MTHTHKRENRSGHVQSGLVIILGVLAFYLQCFEHVPNHFQPLLTRVFVGFNMRTVEIESGEFM